MQTFDHRHSDPQNSRSEMRESALRELRDAVTVIRLYSQLLQRRSHQRGSLDPASTLNALLAVERASVTAERSLNALQDLP